MATTIYDLIAEQRETARVAKREAQYAKEDSQADPKNRQLRRVADDAAFGAAEAGRKVAEYEFIARIDEWHARDLPVDELLLKLAPRVYGEVDDEWLAAAHLARAGVKPPVNWRSSVSGEPIHDNVNQSNALSAA